MTPHYTRLLIARRGRSSAIVAELETMAAWIEAQWPVVGEFAQSTSAGWRCARCPRWMRGLPLLINGAAAARARARGSARARDARARACATWGRCALPRSRR